MSRYFAFLTTGPIIVDYNNALFSLLFIIILLSRI